MALRAPSTKLDLVPNFIGGASSASHSSRRLEVTDPSTGEVYDDPGPGVELPPRTRRQGGLLVHPLDRGE